MDETTRQEDPTEVVGSYLFQGSAYDHANTFAAETGIEHHIIRDETADRWLVLRPAI